MKNKEKVKSKVQIVGAKKGVNGKNNKGITLIALVITIIVLIILAGVSINLVLGENGLFTRARKATEDYQQAAINEQEGFNALYDEIGTYGEGNPSENQGSQISPTTPNEVAELIGKSASDTNQDVIDSYGNKVIIPAGFTVVPNGEDRVEYNYSGDNRPNVQDGIVIEDSEGNQFVWIPVGEIKNKENDKNGTTTTITLGRYTFDKTNGNPSEAKTGITDVIENDFTEDTTTTHNQEYQNTIAKDIDAFKNSATTNHGYYLARYEAAKGTADKVQSKSATVWNKITEPEAAKKAQEMYSDNTNFTSDLVNSYAWDTAIVFIQKYSGNSNYANQPAKNYAGEKESPDNTGERNGTTDKVCNIYDMASNCFEWITETCNDSDIPCAQRGGVYYEDIYYPSSRVSDTTLYANDNTSFRPLLYIINTKG